jgi:hypothetical protein
MSDPRYHEADLVGWRWALYIPGLLIFLTGVGLTLPVDLRQDPMVLVFWGIAYLAGSSIGMIGYTFSSYEVLAEGDTLNVGFRGWKVQLPIASLTDLEATEVSFTTYNGVGWRLGFDGTVGYIPRLGPAVLVTTPDHTYCLTCRDPDALIHALRTLQATAD